MTGPDAVMAPLAQCKVPARLRHLRHTMAMQAEANLIHQVLL